MGSMAMAPGFALAPTPAYKISKAALNMLTVQYALDLGGEGFIFLPVSPGVCLNGLFYCKAG
jgi:NAD(P)-dependent dehydrogenase (short-subunit alcohol dehydrogenase family)